MEYSDCEERFLKIKESQGIEINETNLFIKQGEKRVNGNRRGN